MLNAIGASSCRLTNGILALHRTCVGVPVTMLPRANPPPPAMLQQTLRLAGRNRNLVILSPEAQLPKGYRAIRLARGITIAGCDLRPDPDTLRRGMHQKWRNRLHRAERSPLRVRVSTGPCKDLDWILAKNLHQQNTRGYRTWSEKMTRCWAHLHPDRTLLFTAIDHTTQVAAMLVLHHGDHATYHIGVTTEQGRQNAAHNLLMWSAMRHMSDRGCHHMDLGRTDISPGLTRFKLGTGAQPRVLGGTWLWFPSLFKRR